MEIFEDTADYFLTLLFCQVLLRYKPYLVDELVVEQAVAFCIDFRQYITDMLKIRLGVGQPAARFEFCQNFKVEYLFALSAYVVVDVPT